MTREERNNAKHAFCERMYRDGLSYDPSVCFDEGVEWADEHPKSPWISVEDDLPYNNPNNIHFGFTNRVLATDGEKIFVVYMKKDKDNKWIWWSEDNVDISHIITHWMPFPKPPKEQKVYGTEDWRRI